jgi:hypothetical protein
MSDNIPRKRLPDRRAHDVISITHNTIKYDIGIGVYSDGNVAEVFISSTKAATDVAAAGRDLAVLLSLALQHGVPLEAVRDALTRDEWSNGAGLLGAVVDALFEYKNSVSA